MKTITFLKGGEECVVNKVRNCKDGADEGLKFWKGTLLEYNSMSSHDLNTLYIIQDEITSV